MSSSWVLIPSTSRARDAAKLCTEYALSKLVVYDGGASCGAIVRGGGVLAVYVTHPSAVNISLATVSPVPFNISGVHTPPRS